jgi:hypothetical protein
MHEKGESNTMTHQINIEKEIEALKYHRKVAEELHRLGWLNANETRVITGGLTSAIAAWWCFYEDIKRKTFPIREKE